MSKKKTGNIVKIRRGGNAKGSGIKRWTARDQRKDPRPLPIREKRHAAGLTLEDVAKHIGISLAEYSRKELNPHRFRWDHIEKLAALFGCSPSDLMSGEDQPEVALAAFRRTVPVYRYDKATEAMLKLNNYAPTVDVSTKAYAIEALDDSMRGGDSWSIKRGDWCVCDPSATPRPGDVVDATDPETGERILRTYVPLHPSNPRAPGFLLRAVRANTDEIYIPAKKSSECIHGVVVEQRVIRD